MASKPTEEQLRDHAHDVGYQRGAKKASQDERKLIVAYLRDLANEQKSAGAPESADALRDAADMIRRGHHKRSGEA